MSDRSASVDLPAPEATTRETADDLTAALVGFEAVAAALEAGPIRRRPVGTAGSRAVVHTTVAGPRAGRGRGGGGCRARIGA